MPNHATLSGNIGLDVTTEGHQEVLNHVPLVSLGLPVYNGENFVAEAIRCVQAQTFSDWELVISDNGSTDRTIEICESFAQDDKRIRIFRSESNMGVCFNFNRAFTLSRGQYFKWVTHDDLFGPEFVQICLDELQEQDHAVVAFPQLVHIDERGEPLRKQTSNLSVLGSTAKARVEHLMQLESEGTDIFWVQFGLFRREVLAKTRLMGLYNGSDQTLLLELAIQGCFRQVEKQLFFRREHAGASTIRTNWTARDRAKFVYAHDRRVLVFPYCRMLKEHLVSVHRSPISLGAKIQCGLAVFARFCRQWKYFAHEFLDSASDIVGLAKGFSAGK